MWGPHENTLKKNMQPANKKKNIEEIELREFFRRHISLLPGPWHEISLPRACLLNYAQLRSPHACINSPSYYINKSVNQYLPKAHSRAGGVLPTLWGILESQTMHFLAKEISSLLGKGAIIRLH